MGLNEQVSAERIHIGFFGLRNAGKSSVVNAVTGQKLSLVSDIKGTTTDPVKKSMEILPIGPVVIIDTPGMDDTGALGEMRVKSALKILNQTDLAVLVVDGQKGLQKADCELIGLFVSKKIPYIVAYNKSDLLSAMPEAKDNEIYVSAVKNENIYELKEFIGRKAKAKAAYKPLVEDLVEPKDIIVLVTPIDSAAPKGRLILPQQQMIRSILDAGGISIVTKETELSDALYSLSKKPKLVITDSQAFARVNKETPMDIMLTSFSILFARYKGDLQTAVKGAAQLDKLKDGDTILISEGCTHHRQCDDIGTVKMPKWIADYTGKNLNFEWSSGTEFPDDLSKYAVVVHCGGCMLNEREMKSRIAYSLDNNVPITNYGIAIAHMNGILKRALQPFPEVLKLLADD